MTPKPGSFKKVAAPAVAVKRDTPPPTEVRRAPQMPGQTIVSRITKPVGAAVVLVLLASGARAQGTSISAPQGGAGACPFPACRGQTSVVDVSLPPYLADGGGDLTGPIQRAVDTCAPVIYFPENSYAVCNLMPRCPTPQLWQGAGAGRTFLVGTPGCNSPIVTSAGGIFAGPVPSWTVQGFTFGGAVQNDLSVQCRDIERVVIRNNAFDTGGLGCPASANGPNGINLAGCRNFLVEDNEFYSSCPGSGGRGILAAGIRGGTIRRNVSTWQNTFLEVASTQNQPAGLTTIEGNTFHGTFWAIPTKYTNSGATVSYAGTVLTDSNAAFTGLCGGTDTPPASCAAAAGNFLRVMSVRVSGTTGTFNTAGGYLTDTGKNFLGAGVQRGDLVRTTPVCFGNGTKTNGRNVCTGAAGASAWGDSCVCTANADCASAVCEPRFATVDQVGTSTTLYVDEWVRDTTCPLGAAICPTSNRRPAGAPLTTTGIAYTIYSWVLCHVASYTATTATCDTDGWTQWTGSASTPAAQTLYEVMYPRPTYFLLAGNTGTTTVQGLRIRGNTAIGGFADHFELTGERMIVVGNYSRDCGDTCFVFAGDQYTVSNNVAEHCGARGFTVIGNDQIHSTNLALDSPWIRTSNTTTAGEYAITGNRNTVVNTKVKTELPVNLNRYGFVVFGVSDDNGFDDSTCVGSYSQGCFRFDGASATRTHLINYRGESISNNSGTFSVDGGKIVFSQLPAATSGSYVGCGDCNVAAPCTSGGGGAMAIRSATGPQWNCR